jgi:hypothetical protein
LCVIQGLRVLGKVRTYGEKDLAAAVDLVIAALS